MAITREQLNKDTIYRVTGGGNFGVGDLVELDRDDGTNCPFFRRIGDGEWQAKKLNNLEIYKMKDEPKFKAMKFWIGDDPELSKKVQEILFGLGYGWCYGGKKLMDYSDLRYIKADDSGDITQGASASSFTTASGQEINIDWMRTPPARKTVTLSSGETYYEDEVESRLTAVKAVTD